MCLFWPFIEFFYHASEIVISSSLVDGSEGIVQERTPVPWELINRALALPTLGCQSALEQFAFDICETMTDGWLLEFM